MASSALIDPDRPEWIAHASDRNIRQVDNVRRVICVTIYASEISGDGFADITGDRGYFKLRLLQFLLACTQITSKGTNIDEVSAEKLSFSFMYKDDIPKIEVYLEEVTWERSGELAALRYIFVMKDPYFLCSDCAPVVMEMNAKAKATEEKKGGRRSRLEATTKGTEYRDVQDLDSLRKLLQGYFRGTPYSEKLSDKAAVYNRSYNLASSRNPACFEMCLSFERAVNISNIPLDIKCECEAKHDTLNPEQMDWSNYGPGIVGDAAAAAPAAAAAAPDRSRESRFETGLSFDDMLPDDTPPASPAMRDVEPPRQQPMVNIMGHEPFTLTFPCPDKVYYLEFGPSLNPLYIFPRLRPDACAKKKSIQCALPKEPSMLIQQIYSADDEELQRMRNGLLLLRTDMTGNVLEMSSDTGGLMRELAKRDVMLRMRLANIPILDGLKAERLAPEMKAAKIRKFKEGVVDQLIGYMMNGDQTRMNKVTKAFSIHIKNVLKDYKTFVGDTVCFDPTLSTFSNFLGLFRAAEDKLMTIYTQHQTFENIFFNALTVYYHEYGMANNIMMPGNAMTGKSFLLQMLANKVFVNGTVDLITRESDKADQVEGDFNFKIVAEEEIQHYKLDQSADGKDTVAKPEFKSKLTAGFMRIDRAEVDPKYGVITVHLYIPCKTVYLEAFNNKYKGISAATKSRYAWLPVQEDERDERDLKREEVINGCWSKDKALEARFELFFQNMQTLFFLVERLIGLGGMEDVDLALARHCAMMLNEEMTSRGLELDKRDVQRLLNLMRVFAITRAIHAHFFTELGAKYKNKPWDFHWLLDLEPHLLVNRELAVSAITLLSPSFLPKDRHAILCEVAAQAGATLPVFEGENGDSIVNMPEVDWKENVDTKRNQKTDYVCLYGEIEDLSEKASHNMPCPRPPPQVISNLLRDLQKMPVYTPNRNSVGDIITVANQFAAPVASNYRDYRNADDQPDQQQQQQRVLPARPIDRPGQHKIKALIAENTKEKQVIYIATQLFRENNSGADIIQATINRICDKYTPEQKILTFLPYIHSFPDGTKRKFQYLCQPMSLKPDEKKVITTRLPFSAEGHALLLYSSTEPTDDLMNPEVGGYATEVIEGDWEEMLYEKRLAMLTPEQVREATLFIPRIAEKHLRAWHNDPAFRSQICVPKLTYPEDIVTRILDEEALADRVRKGDKAALKDRRVKIYRGGMLAKLMAEDVRSFRDYLPSTYMTEKTIQRTRSTLDRTSSWKPTAPSEEHAEAAAKQQQQPAPAPAAQPPAEPVQRKRPAAVLVPQQEKPSKKARVADPSPSPTNTPSPLLSSSSDNDAFMDDASNLMDTHPATKTIPMGKSKVRLPGHEEDEESISLRSYFSSSTPV